MAASKFFFCADRSTSLDFEEAFYFFCFHANETMKEDSHTVQKIINWQRFENMN